MKKYHVASNVWQNDSEDEKWLSYNTNTAGIIPLLIFNEIDTYGNHLYLQSIQNVSRQIKKLPETPEAGSNHHQSYQIMFRHFAKIDIKNLFAVLKQ